MAQETPKQSHRQARTHEEWGKGKRYRVKGIPGVRDRSFNTSDDAKSWLAIAKADSKRGELHDPRDGSILLADYIEREWWPNQSYEPSTEAPTRSRIWNHIMPLLGSTALIEIDAAALRAFKAALLSRVADSTAEVIWTHLSGILTAAVEDKRLLKHPMKVHRSIKRPKRQEKKRRHGLALPWTRFELAFRSATA
ncbi:hypothetical protein [Streptomyces mayteni]